MKKNSYFTYLTGNNIYIDINTVKLCHMCSLIMYLYFWQFTQKCSEWISDSYCRFGMGKTVLARTLPTLHPHTLPLCCNYLGYKYPRAMGGINTYVRRFAAGSFVTHA